MGWHSRANSVDLNASSDKLPEGTAVDDTNVGLKALLNNQGICSKHEAGRHSLENDCHAAVCMHE